MFKKITSLFRGNAGKQGEVKLGKDVFYLADENVLDEYFERLPGFPQGIPVIPIELLIKKNDGLIKQIILARGLSGAHNNGEVEAKVMVPIRHLAEMTHLLPASEKRHFKLPGGLFAFCLEVSLISIRYAERRILTRATPEIRKEYEALWAQAAFLNGLFSEAITAISKISVYAHDGSNEWHPGAESLYGWLRRNQLERYHIRWSGKEDRSMIYILSGKAISKEQSELLAQGETAIYTTLIRALIDQSDVRNNPLAKINEQVKYKIMERDEWSHAGRYGKPLAGMHLEPWLIDAMRYLVQKKRWVPNEDNGRVWQGQDGVFLLWPLAASDMQYQLRESECPFVPSTDEILAEILLDAGIIASSNGMNRYLFEIAVPVADSTEKKHVDAIKLTRHEILFIKTDHQSLGFDLLVEVVDEEDGQNKAIHEITESSPNRQEAVNPVSVTETPKIDSEPVDMNILFDKQATPVMGHKATQDKPCGIEENPGLETPFSDEAVSSGINLYDDDYAAEYRHEKAQKHPSGSTRIPARPLCTQMDDPGTGAGQDTHEDLLGSLIGSSRTKPETGQVKPHGLPKEKKPELYDSDQGRSTMILSRLKKLPEEYLEARPGGITKVISKGLKAINLELKDCVSVLKADGLLILVDGYESGLDSTAKPKSRYFLVKADLLNDK